MSDPVSASVAVEPDSSAVATSEPAKRPASRIRIAVLYCTLVFAFSWSIWILAANVQDTEWIFNWGSFRFDLTRRWVIGAVGGASPAFVACVLGLVTRWRYFPSPVSQIRSPIRPRGLYLAPIFAPFMIFVLALLAQGGFSEAAFESLGSFNPFVFVLLLFVNLPIASIWEEPGWRGCLLPILSPDFGLWGGALIVGVIWAVWHLPLYFLLEGISVKVAIASCFAIVGMAIVIAAFYRNTGNSLRLPILFHAAWNAMARGALAAGWDLGLKAAIALAVGAWLLAAFCWLWWSGERDKPEISTGTP
jgi:membrane protease YdiL (CAAX protease family)